MKIKHLQKKGNKLKEHIMLHEMAVAVKFPDIYRFYREVTVPCDICQKVHHI